MTYFITPNYSVALNTKVGSSSLASAIIKQYYPEMWAKLEGAAYPPGLGVYDYRWHTRCPRERIPNKPVVLPVRNVVDRFVSACGQVNIGEMNVDLILDALENGTMLVRNNGREFDVQGNEHFTHQYMLQYNETHLFKFPNHANAMATFIRVESPLPVVNDGALKPTPTLTQSQTQRVRAYYEKDHALFQSITSADTVVTIDPEDLKPLPEEPMPDTITALQFRKWLLSNGHTTSELNTLLDTILDETQKESLKIDWEYSTVFHRKDAVVRELTRLLLIKPKDMNQAFREAVLL